MLIASNQILTAKHCVDPSEQYSVRLYDGRDVRLEGVQLIRDESTIGETDTFDWTIIKFTNALGIAPIKVARLGVTEDLLGKTLSVIGFGNTTYTGTDAFKRPSTPLEATVQLEEFGRGLMFSKVSDQGPRVGDSGGPLFLKGADASQDVLVGIIKGGHARKYTFVDARVLMLAPAVAPDTPEDRQMYVTAQFQLDQLRSLLMRSTSRQEQRVFGALKDLRVLINNDPSLPAGFDPKVSVLYFPRTPTAATMYRTTLQDLLLTKVLPAAGVAPGAGTKHLMTILMRRLR